MPKIQFLDARPLSERASHLVFRAPFRHAAGQYVALEIEIDGEPAKAYYSIASPPRDDCRIEFCVRHDGRFGRRLLALRPGERVACSEPSGRMRLLDPRRPAVYFAAGTGISPLRAILIEQLAENPGADAVLVLGARHVGDLLYRAEFEETAARGAGFRFLPSVSGDAADWTGLRGRVTEHLDAALRGRADVDAYFCGPREMVTALRERLAAVGIADDRQSFERY